MRVLFRFFAALSTFALCAGALAADHSALTFDDGKVEAFSRLEAGELSLLEPLPKTPGNDVDFLLINGTPVNPDDFPAVFKMVTNGTCTATAIGPATILIAAHCAGDRSMIGFKSAAGLVRGICIQSPYYSPTLYNDDLSLCLMERTMAGIAFESIDIRNPTMLNETVFLTGYGCQYEDGPLDGLLRIGVSTIANKPRNFRYDESTIYSRSDINAGGAILCPGDSGGPLYRFSGGPTEERVIVGVNSRTTYSHGVSLFAALASPTVKTFVEDWAEEYDQRICGLNLLSGCR